MGQRVLEISTDLIFGLLKGLWESPQPRYFKVFNPLPKDVKVLSIGYSQYRPNVIEVVMESNIWEKTNERTLVDTINLTTVEGP